MKQCGFNMFKREYTRVSLKLIFILGVISLFPLTQGSAVVVWEEDWENFPFDEWVTQAYFSDEETIFYPNSSANPAVVDGAFYTNSPSDVFGEYWSGAICNSTVTSGTWSFDWVIEPGVEHESYVNVFFMANGFAENLTGKAWGDPVSTDLYTTGYVLNLQSCAKGPLSSNSINLGRLGVGGGTLASKAFSTSISGSHHIDVTRTPEGIQITPYDPQFEAAMKAFEYTRRKYRNALKELAK